MHGAAYGKGIYLSPLSSVSFGYTLGYYGKVKSDKEVGYSQPNKMFVGLLLGI